MKSLLDWIAQLEAEEFPKNLDRRIAGMLRADFPTLLVRGTRSDPTPYFSHVEQVLRKLWNDVPFWVFQMDLPTGDAIAAYIRENFDLVVPPFPHAVWSEMTRDEVNRKRLFNLLKFKPGALPHITPSVSEMAAIENLCDAQLVDLFFDYMRASHLDRKRTLALLRFKQGSYKVLASAAARLSKDALWCAALFENKSPKIPAAALLKRRGRTAAAEPILRTEKLVQIAHRMPHATCYEMVKEFKRSGGEVLEFKGEKSLRGLRSEANKAKRLAELRDGVKVTYHTREGRGRRPPRKNLGAAN